jgi:hypothetical protein
MSFRFDPVIQEIEVLLAESAQLAASGPHFIILHRLWERGSNCLPGEEIAGIWLVYRGREFQLRLSLALRLLFDHLARRRWLAQSASQIESAMKADAFYARHGTNVRTSTRQTRRITRSAIKTYIQRIRKALRSAFEEAGVQVDSANVLASRPTEGNEIAYQLRATIAWVHTR